MAVGLDLDQYQLRKRVLLVFAPNPEDVRWDVQQAYLEDGEDELTEQKIVVFGIFEDGPSFAEERPVSSEDSQRARDDFGVRGGRFALHLLDLDGTEILDSSEPLAVEDLIEVIDEKPDD